MSHLVVDSKVLDSKKDESAGSERESRELKREAPRYVKKIVQSGERMDQELVLLYKALNSKTDLSKELARYD